ncbi:MULTISPECIES: hypothetical protein [unclassified Bradyrhizobium]|uniref:hypothetical protein n=1 Tax=unclassified Bradyrhizobium TaxID=2631580 RepID=UPI00247A1F84|nr:MULTISPECIES: hypothetical protein [unclassified Bradyrhizobium]WGR69523.1 hypothetical protein MTX24_29445 [Bradyrhizobium sp. ISRA426]WGR81579.1 hypothetical protein MTX21_14555 [Bradyrhizobium sp. ISRA430]WGR84763.1 hypothetical protein MTX25_29120 [Bradyrhizobium sp. ISRA432]
MKWTILAAALEAAVTGLVLFVWPPLFAWLVFGAEFSNAGDALGGLTAIVLLALVLATWPSTAKTPNQLSSVRTLLIYNLLAAIYLVYVGLGGKLTGILLWPATALHAIFALLLGAAWFSTREIQEEDFSI